AIPQSDDTSSTPTAPINTLIVRVAKSEGLAPEDLEILSMAETTWNDTSLGCPQPDMVYAQILVSGWLIRLQDAAGNEYEIHTGKDMEPFIVCDTGTTIIRPLPDRPPQSNPAVDAAIRWLAENKNISSETVLVKSIESVQWPDSCLGCPQTKETCLMVVTPGYRIVLLSEDQTYELYTDEIGRNVRHCTTLDGTPSVKE
ncbi:MAG: hypothetical protein JXA33_12265, partial [Anaerolineae bacterium]|nr:hypothetical protein [Anaerolineae bacterium]